MNEQTPKQIIDRIQQAEEERKARQITNAANAEIEKQEVESQFWEEAERFFEEVLSQIDGQILEFVKMENFKTTGRYGIHHMDRVLEFHVPGLAPFGMVFEINKPTQKHEFEKWIFPYIAEDGENYEAGYSWNVNYGESVLANEFTLNQVLYSCDLMNRQMELTIERFKKMKAADEQRQIEREAQKQTERDEEQALFDALKNDSIAIHLLKAFVLLRDERSHFESRLEEADEAMYSIENRWSRRAEQLRDLADNIQRRADDERYRLENDLSDAESELKKAQRGW